MFDPDLLPRTGLAGTSFYLVPSQMKSHGCPDSIILRKDSFIQEGLR